MEIDPVNSLATPARKHDSRGGFNRCREAVMLPERSGGIVPGTIHLQQGYITCIYSPYFLTIYKNFAQNPFQFDKMSVHFDLKSCHRQESCSTATTTFEPPRISPQTSPYVYEQSYPESIRDNITEASPPTRAIFEGYKFYKADPIPGEEATWKCIERTELHIEPKLLCEMIHERADRYSATQQYLNLRRDQRAQVDLLVQEQRENDQKEWSCVYAKENYDANKARNPGPDDFETVSIVIILMGRPMKTTKYPRTPMGDLVDLRELRDPYKGKTNHYIPRPVRADPSQGFIPARVVAPKSVFSIPFDSDQLPVYDQ
jgi:hypothetical protein